MEAVEDPTLEPAIGWLADTILVNLRAGGKLDPWIRQAGLGNDAEKLKSEVGAVEMVVSAMQGRAAGNKPLTRSLTALKVLLYDADDVVDELDCYRLQHELQPEALLEIGGPQQVERSSENADDVQSSSNVLLRSEEWKHFDITQFEPMLKKNGVRPVKARCKRCQKELMCTTDHGTSILKNHLKSKGCKNSKGGASHPSSTADATTIPTPVATASGKRMRTSQESTAANPNGWNRDAFSERIQDITSQLQGKREAITRLLKILGPDSGGASLNHCQSTISDPCRRTSSLVQGKVYGRAAEKKSIKKLIEEHKSTAGVTVLPIVGIGGVGKTALAQLVYNDPALQSQFDHKIWIWVSKDFDEMRLTREMLDCVSQETYDGLCSFTKLQEVLKGHIKSKRVLLILDDVWGVMDDCRWNKLLAPFKSDNAKGNMIIMTTRKPSVAKSRGTIGPINLYALGKDRFWQLFKSCVFGDENYEAQASLGDLGQEIAQKLKGNPLAAQTAGALLRDHLTVDHWINTLKTEAWNSLQHTGGIMSALKLSYDELPYPVQQCFSYCSIFRCNYNFFAEELVRFWISQGFVKCDHSSKSLEEMGRCYLTDLVNLGLFEEVEIIRSSLHSQTQTCYAMCGPMHDFARLVSRTECATLDGLQYNEILPNVHHLSIVTSSVYRWDRQTGNLPRNEKFEFFLQNIVASVRKLRTLVLIGEYDSFFFKAFQDVFGKAHNLRLLQMSATSADFNSFLCSLANPTRLRYLKLQDGHPEQKALPLVLSKFFHLQVLNIAYFMPLHTIHLEDCGEWRILPSLAMLRFLKRLKLCNMQTVREVLVPSLVELVLDGMPDLQRCSCTSVGDMKSSLRVLDIQSCPALELFDLFQKGHNYKIEYKSWLPNLRKLIMHNCPHLQVQTPLPPSAIFSELSINKVSTIMTMEGSSMEKLKISGDKLLCDTLDDKSLAFHNLKDIKYLEISSCGNLTSISFRGLSQLISLKSLKICYCKELFSSDDVPEQTYEDMINANEDVLPSLESLYIRECGITGKWLSLMLRHSPALKELYLYGCPQLKELKIEEDGNVQSNLISDSEALSSGRCRLPQSLELLVWWKYPRETLRPCFVDNLTCLKKLVVGADSLKYIQLDSCTALEDLEIGECGRLIALEGMQSLRSLALNMNSRLKSLQLNSCTSLERLAIFDCSSLVALEGLRSLVNLKHLVILGSPALDSLATLESYELFPALESLEIDGLSPLNTPFCKGLTCLRSLKLSRSDATELTDEQGRALLLLRSLQELCFDNCEDLVDLPAGLRGLPSLKTLKIKYCSSISGLWKESLPPSLEELVIFELTDELSEGCELLATSKLDVKINRCYVG